MNTYTVVIGCIGTAYHGPDEEQAQALYDSYVEYVQRPGHRATGESVTLLVNDGIVSEHTNPDEEQGDQ